MKSIKSIFRRKRKALVRLSFIVCIICLFISESAYIPAAAGDAEKRQISGERVSGLAMQLLDKETDDRGTAEYSCVLYDNTNGLPTSEVRVMAETEDGFIWMGCENGLIRYDGRSFEQIGSKQGISNVLSLYADSSDRLWVGTNDSGAVVMYRDDVRIFDKSLGLKSLSVKTVTEDVKGDIYLGTTEGIGVVSADLNRLDLIDDERISDKYIISLENGADGAVYGVTITGDVFRIVDRVLTDYVSSAQFPEGQIHAVLPDPENPGYIYCGTTESLIYYCRIDGGMTVVKTINFGPAYYINSMEYIGGNIWVCADNGFWPVVDDKPFFVMDLPYDFTFIKSIMKDYQGNLWVVSSQSGVFKIVRNRFLNLIRTEYYGENTVNAILKYNDSLYVGMGNDFGISVFDDQGVDIVYELPLDYVTDTNGNTEYYDSLSEYIYQLKIQSFYEDSMGRLWICSMGENPLVCYDGISAVNYGPGDGMPSTRARAVTERADGSFAVACTGGLAVIADGKISRVYTEKDGFRSTELLTVVENAAGELIIGTDGGGLYILGNNGLTHIGTEEGLSSDVVVRVKKDARQDIIWIFTGNSISYMTSDHKIVRLENFPYAGCFDLYENHKGELWILSSNGIYVVSKSELLGNSEINAIYYGISNGLPYSVTTGSYSALTEDGILYISGQKGAIRVNIDEESDYHKPVRMSIPYVDADGVIIYPDEEGNFTLEPDVKRLTIYGFVCDYTLNDSSVTYWLEGFDDVKTTVSENELAPVVYTNLKGSEYTFNMLFSDPKDGERQISVRIVKKLAIYEQLWFRIAVIAAVMALIVLAVAVYYRHRIRVYRKKAEENRILVREIVEAFAKVIDMKDKYTNGHSERVADYTVLLAEELGYDPETVEKYRNIALMHDIGKVGVPADVLNKPGKLTDDEFHTIQSHSSLGYETLKGISIMPDLAEGAFSHHERPDGKGYPRGLKGEKLPRVAQIIAVADTFDAMYSNRPYRKRMNFDRAVSIIKEASGTQLTPDVVDAFSRLVEKGRICPAPDDDGNSGTTENIDNIRKGYDSKE